MSDVIISYWSKELGTTLVESSLPVWGQGEVIMNVLRSMWKYTPHNKSTVIEISKHSYDLRWYRRGDRIVVQM